MPIEIMVIGGVFIYLLGSVITAVIWSNFWNTRFYNSLDPAFLVCSIAWPICFPLMVIVGLFNILSFKLGSPGWIQELIVNQSSKKKKLLENKIKEQADYIDSLEQKFRELEQK